MSFSTSAAEIYRMSQTGGEGGEMKAQPLLPAAERSRSLSVQRAVSVQCAVLSLRV